MLRPKILTTLKGYSLKQFSSDFTAGIIVGVVALPLAIAFAIASGLSPDKGLITAVIAGFLISLLGGSRVQIGGPTGAFVVIVYSIVAKIWIEGLLLATFIAGILLIIMGLAQLGGVIKFIPYPVVVGFTSGIAVIIFFSQLKDFFGLNVGDLPGDFIDKINVYFHNFNSINLYALSVGVFTIIILIFWQRFSKRIPGSLIAILISTLLVHFLKFPIETIGSRFGEIPSVIPKVVIPGINFSLIKEILPSAITIALLAGIESLLSAIVADGMIGGRHRSNMELVAQGVANIVSSLFGGMPATGAIARTATNIHNGGRTPIAGIVHALTLLSIMLFFGKLVVYIPLACLAGILIVVAYRMSEWHSFVMILKSPRSDIAVLLVTFFLTVIIDLTVAIEVGMILSAFLLIRRLVLATNIEVFTREFKDEEERSDPNAIGIRKLPDGVEVFEVSGPFFFGIASTFIETVKNIEEKPKIRILRMRNVLSIDVTALNALKQILKESRKAGIRLILSGVHSQPYVAIKRIGLADDIGEENIFTNIDDALVWAEKILNNTAA